MEHILVSTLNEIILKFLNDSFLFYFYFILFLLYEISLSALYNKQSYPILTSSAKLSALNIKIYIEINQFR